MKIKMIPVLAVLLLILGCESTPHYDRTKLVTFGPAFPKKPFSAEHFYWKKEEVPVPYDVIGLMTLEGNPGDEAAFIKAFLYRAVSAGSEYRPGMGTSN